MKKFKYLFTVVSVGYPFPVDMLRYDRATPATEQDSHAIARTIRQEGHGGEASPTVEVRLEAIHERGWVPTVGRWESMQRRVRSGIERRELP